LPQSNATLPKRHRQLKNEGLKATHKAAISSAGLSRGARSRKSRSTSVYLLNSPSPGTGDLTAAPFRSPFSSTSWNAEHNIVILTDSESHAILSLIKRLPIITDTSAINTLWLNEIDYARSYLPERLIRALSGFRRSGNQSGALIIRNLPKDPALPDTPADGRQSLEKLTSVSECILLLSMLSLGEPISYLDEKEGALIQNICPIKGREQLQENTGSAYLEFHVEDGFHPYKPDYLGLICLKGDRDHKAMTVSASIRKVLPHLPWRAIDLLSKPLFHLRLSSSFTGTSEQRYVGPMPVLTGHLLEPDMCIDHFLMEGTTPEAKWALETLKRLLVAAAEPIDLQPGDMMIIDNRTAAHGRTGLTPRYDGQDRWLQRMFVVADARRSRGSRGLQSTQCVPLDIEFSANPQGIIC